MTLKKLQQNKSQLRKGVKTNCISVLGSQTDLNVCAGIWEQYKELFGLIDMHLLLDFCTKQTFTSDELALYKKGLADLPNFLKECLLEVRTNEEFEKQKKKLEKENVDVVPE